MARTAIAFIGAFFLGMFVALLLSAQGLIEGQTVFQWACLALAILLFIAAAFVGQPHKKETTET